MVSFGHSKSGSTSFPVDMTYDPFQSIAPSVAGKLRTIYDAAGVSGVPDYEGALYAPITSREESVLGDVVSTGTRNPFLASSNRLLEDTIAGRYVDPESNPFLKAYIATSQRPVIESYRGATQGDYGTFANAGANLDASSPYANARSIADRGISNALGDVASRIGTSAYELERGLQAAAPTQASELRSAELQRQIETLSAAALPRLIEEQGIERGLDVYKQRLAALQNVLGISAQATRPVVANESKSKSSAWSFALMNVLGGRPTGAGSGGGGQTAGAAAGAGAAASAAGGALL